MCGGFLANLNTPQDPFHAPWKPMGTLRTAFAYEPADLPIATPREPTHAHHGPRMCTVLRWGPCLTLASKRIHVCVYAFLATLGIA